MKVTKDDDFNEKFNEMTNSQKKRRSLWQNSKVKVIPLTSASKMESNGITFRKMTLMTLMTSLKEDESNEVKVGS